MNQYEGVCVLKEKKLIDEALNKTEIGEVWGIGNVCQIF